MPTSESWRLARSLEDLRSRINTIAPRRSKASDGTIGDPAHRARTSDHNPNADGVVCALDITHDPAGGCDAGAIAESLRQSKDPRIKYVIWNKRIFSSTMQPWVWRPYTGTNPHQKHVHVSVKSTICDLKRDWNVKVS